MVRHFASGLVSCGILLASASAQAFGGWMAQDPGFRPVEQRVALAVTPQRTTLWTSLRFRNNGGAVGVVIPVAPGAVVDISSDAWFESLEVSTAPRVFPSPAASPYCPGTSSGPATPFDVAGHTEHTVSAPIVESALLADAAGVQAWAAARGMTLSAALQAGLGSSSGSSFLAMRLDAPAGHGIAPTVRVAIPGSGATLPLSLTQATHEDLLVTTWLLGSGAGQLDGSDAQVIAPESLIWDADAQASSYADARLAALTSGAASLLEATGHDGIAADTPIQDDATIDGLLRTYFDRATSYDGLPVDPAACLTAAAAAFSSTDAVAPSCPRGLLVPPPSLCVEMPLAGSLDPQTLRCGAVADDVAVALSGASPGATFLTRQSLVIQNGDHGFDWHATFAPLTPLVPVVVTSEVDTSSCPSSPFPGGYGGEGGSGTYAGSGPGNPGGSIEGSSGGSADLSGVDGDVDASSGDCSGDSGGGDCGGDSGGGDCSGGDIGDIGSLDCSVHHHQRAPQFFPVVVGLLALLAPLRRRARRTARGAGSAPGTPRSG